MLASSAAAGPGSGNGGDGGDEGCGDDEGWTLIPAEEWHPLAQLKVRQSE